jgi:predicted NACHT family NTPase
VAYSPDGRRLASASLGDHTVKVWDASTGQQLLALTGHRGAVNGVAYSPDGRRLASASHDQAVKVWDAATGQELFSLQGHTHWVRGVAYSPDGRRLASASSDQTVKVWDAATGQELLALTGHTSVVTGVAFNPGGRRLASASWDQTVRVWDASTGQQLLALKGHKDRVQGVAYSPDGRRLASASQDQTVKVWDASTGQELLPLKGHTDWVTGVAFSPDGRRLASASRDQTVKIWDASTGQEILTLKGHTPWTQCVAFSPDGCRLASASSDQTVKVWDATVLTPQMLIEREAHGLVQFLFAKQLPRSDVLATIREDATIGEPVREAALKLAETFPEDANALNNASRAVVRQPGADAAAYQRALRQAEAACRLAPDNANYLNTLGVAYYRVGKYPEALQALTRSDWVHALTSWSLTRSAGASTVAAAAAGTGAAGPFTALASLLGRTVRYSDPADLAFLAMAQHQLGHKEQARTTLARLRETMKQPRWAKYVEAQGFLREAEALIDGKAAEPKK